MPDHHNQGTDDDTAAYHCAPDHDKRVRITAAPHGRPHARYDSRAGNDLSAARDDRTAADHNRAGNDGPAPGHDPTGYDRTSYDRTGHDAPTRDYRRTGHNAAAGGDDNSPG